METYAQTVAEYIINQCHNNEQTISNPKLQKLLYFTQVNHLQTYGKPLFKDNIEAWHYGPVIKDVYEHYSGYGGLSIKDYYPHLNPSAIFTTKQLKLIDDTINHYMTKPPREINNEAMKEGNSWHKVYKRDGHRMDININLLKTDKLEITQNKSQKLDYSESNMYKFAKHCVGVAHSYSLPISNVHLQIILYRTIQNNINNPIWNEIYDEKFTLSSFGPRLQSAYYEYKDFNSGAIIQSGQFDSRFNQFESDIFSLLRTDQYVLIEACRNEKIFLENKDNLSNGEHIEYSLDMIKEELLHKQNNQIL